MRKLAARHEGLAQIAIAVAGVDTYELLRRLQRPNWPLALEHAREIVSWERFAHIEWEPALQSAVLRVPGLLTALDGFYFVGHFLFTGVFFLWLYRRSRPAFRIFRNGFLATTVIALVVHWFFPTAPPRLADVGLVHRGYRSRGPLESGRRSALAARGLGARRRDRASCATLGRSAGVSPARCIRRWSC